MRSPLDVSNQKFGRVTAISPDESRGQDGSVVWNCICDCGNIVLISVNKLKTGQTQSCGCFHLENLLYGSTIHGHATGGLSPTYASWNNMLARCTNPNNESYNYYGARGITVCERWFTFENFLADMGEKPEGLLLDRENNDGNYEPGNCRWVNYSVSNLNRRPFKRGSK